MPLKSETLLLCFSSRPGVRLWLLTSVGFLGVGIKLGVVGVVGNGAGVPKGGMFPGAFADDEGRRFCPSLHAAAFALADQPQVASNLRKAARRSKECQRLLGSKQELRPAADSYALKDLRRVKPQQAKDLRSEAG